MWFSPCGKHCTLRFTCFPGRETREPGFPGWRLEGTPWKPRVSRRKHNVKYWGNQRGFLEETIEGTTWKISGFFPDDKSTQLSETTNLGMMMSTCQIIMSPFQKVMRLVIFIVWFSV